MRKTYHVCISSHDEVMFRSEEDFVRGFNCFAVASLTTESRPLADGMVTTHEHFGVCSDDIKETISRLRYSYTRYFNSKYKRFGRLGERNCFITELDGLKHITVGISYILRQGLHHGLSSTPFGYPHCSANAYFREELGKTNDIALLPDSQKFKYLPGSGNIGNNCRMSRDGLLLREDVLDVGYVEEIFVTPRNYIYYMSRFSGEEWEREQREEKSSSPVITLELIERNTVNMKLSEMFANEHGRINKSRMTDLKLCEMVDKEMVPKLLKDFQSDGTTSIYQLSESQRTNLANNIWTQIQQHKLPFATLDQISRCLVVKHK